jgi:hypothetical protein
MDRLKEALAAFVRSVTSRLDYLALYPCKVLSQNGDGTLELKPDDDRLPGLSKIPVKLGLPGVEVKVTSGAKVLLGFEQGDPQKPVATLWEKDSLDTITVTASTKVNIMAPDIVLNGSQPVARQGDSVMVSSIGAPTVLVPGTPMFGTIVAGNPAVKA